MCTTPAGDYLFKVRDDGKKLNKEQAEAFHHTVYQLLFAANRARRDSQTAVSFLTTRVKDLDEDDWKKLVRVLKYLNGTRYMKLTLIADEMNFIIHWYVDGLHQIHEDCQCQIGSLMTLGKGAAISSSNKMKCNTSSSTETELISLHDKLPDIIWTRYFVECQGYDTNECMVFQDNMSTLSLEKNGWISSSERTTHIKAKYFLIKDYYESGEIDLCYCPTDFMWADVLTKPLQGQKFRDKQVFLQNCPRDYDDDIELQNDPLARQTMNHQVKTKVSLRECVGEHSKVETAQNVPVHFGSKMRHVSQCPAETAQNVPVHLNSKVRHPVETAQNVLIHFESKVRHISQSPAETAQNIPVHFEGKNVAVYFSKLPRRQPHIPAKSVRFSKLPTAQNVPVHFEGENVAVHFSKLPQQQPHIPHMNLTNSRVLAK